MHDSAAALAEPRGGIGSGHGEESWTLPCVSSSTTRGGARPLPSLLDPRLVRMELARLRGPAPALPLRVGGAARPRARGGIDARRIS